MRQVEYEVPGRWPMVAVEAVEPEVRAGFDRFEAHQRAGAEYAGRSSDLTRRYELDDGRALYFPELGRPTTVWGALSAVFGIGGICLIIAGLSIDARDFAQASHVAWAGVLTLVAAYFTFSKYSGEAARRQATVETTGLYVFANHIVMRWREGCCVFPKSVVTRVACVRVPNSENSVSNLVVEYRDEAGSLKHVRLNGGVVEEVTALINAQLISIN